MINSGDVLHTNIDLYVHPNHNTRVDVVGMLHYADKPFYDQVQSYLDDRTMDGVNVQYERLTPPKPGEHVTDETAHKAGLLALSSEVVGSLYRSIGLSSQQEALEYRPSWVNQDMSITELVAKLDFRRVVELADEAEVLARTLSGKTPGQRRAVLLGSFQEMLASMSKGMPTGLIGTVMNEVVVDQRNELALGGIDQQKRRRPDTDFALVWGQAHLPGLGIGLSRRGYNLKRQIRVPAIRL